MADQIREHHGEIVGLYYADGSGNQLPLQTIGQKMDSFGWTGGWRIQDSSNKAIFIGGHPDYLWMVTPNVFILETSSMMVVAAEKGTSPAQLNVLSEVAAIDAAN